MAFTDGGSVLYTLVFALPRQVTRSFTTYAAHHYKTPLLLFKQIIPCSLKLKQKKRKLWKSLNYQGTSLVFGVLFDQLDCIGLLFTIDLVYLNKCCWDRFCTHDFKPICGGGNTKSALWDRYKRNLVKNAKDFTTCHLTMVRGEYTLFCCEYLTDLRVLMSPFPFLHRHPPHSFPH